MKVNREPCIDRVDNKEMYESEYYKMLHRDQRTIKTMAPRGSKFDDMKVTAVLEKSKSCRCKCQSRGLTSLCLQCCNQNRQKDHKTSKDSSGPRRRRIARRNTRVGQYKLVEVLLLGVCILHLFKLPTVLSAPVSKRSMDRNMEPPKWINPCNINTSAKDDSPDASSSEPNAYPSRQDLIDLIIIPAKNALEDVLSFRDNYIQKTFAVNFEEHHNHYIDKGSSWLPKIEKKLGERTSEDHLNSQELDTFLKDAYKYLQTYAVGLEQVVWDMKNSDSELQPNDSFYEDFNRTQSRLKAVLCEIQMVMLDRRVEPYDDVTRDVMDTNDRKLNGLSLRNVRDWYILRDYTNALEYILDVCEHLKQTV